jgi:hypothetical protein
LAFLSGGTCEKPSQFRLGQLYFNNKRTAITYNA